MLELSIGITNPFVSKYNVKYLYNKYGSFTANKHWEFEVMYNKSILLGFELGTHLWGSDHEGPSLRVSLLGLEAHFNIYDSRHWDDDKNDWAYYGS